MGRVRALLRLGECANARSRGCIVLAARGLQGGRLSARAWLRNRPDLAAAGAGGRLARRGRSVRSHARPGGRARQDHAGPPPAGRERKSDARSRRHSRSSVSCRSIFAGARAVRRPAVPPARSRSRRRARIRLASPEGRGNSSVSISSPTCRTGGSIATRFSCADAQRGGAHLTLVESVRQDRRRRLTTFEQKYLERRAGRTAEHRFELTFRTLPVRAMVRRLEAAGFVVEATLGDYRGRPWDRRSDVWLILARKPCAQWHARYTAGSIGPRSMPHSSVQTGPRRGING